MGKAKKKQSKSAGGAPGGMDAIDKEMMTLQITDLTTKVTRLSARCDELEASNEELKNDYKKLDDDTADSIAFLKRTLKERSDECDVLQVEFTNLQLEKEDIQEQFQLISDEHDRDFTVMWELFENEIKLLSGKLNMLEDFRLQRDELMAKFKNIEKDIEEQEKAHKKEIYEIEKKFIIAKNRSMKEMENRLLQLSSDLQDVTQMQIAASTQRAVRENIALNSETNKLLETTYKLVKENQMLKEEDRLLTSKNKCYVEEKIVIQEKNISQLKVIEQLTNERNRIVDKVGFLQNALRKLYETEMNSRLMEQHLTRALYELQIQTRKLHASQCLVEEFRYESALAREYIVSLEHAVIITTESVKKVLKRSEIMDEETKTCLLRSYYELVKLKHLKGTTWFTKGRKSELLGIKTSSQSVQQATTKSISYEVKEMDTVDHEVSKVSIQPDIEFSNTEKNIFFPYDSSESKDLHASSETFSDDLSEESSDVFKVTESVIEEPVKEASSVRKSIIINPSSFTLELSQMMVKSNTEASRKSNLEKIGSEGESKKNIESLKRSESQRGGPSQILYESEESNDTAKLEVDKIVNISESKVADASQETSDPQGKSEGGNKEADTPESVPNDKSQDVTEVKEQES